jgi:hypothetical protein
MPVSDSGLTDAMSAPHLFNLVRRFAAWRINGATVKDRFCWLVDKLDSRLARRDHAPEMRQLIAGFFRGLSF